MAVKVSVERIGSAATLFVCLWLGSTLLAQRGDQAPSRSAVIGVVIDQLTGDPVEDVVVEARSDDFFDVASTDATGRFVLSANFPSLVRLSATSYNRGAVVHGSGAFGQTSWEGEARELSVSPGQVLRNITIPFWRAAIVTGRVTDDDGAPVVGARVHVLDRSAEAGHRVFVDVSVWDGIHTFTDENGRYRFLHQPGPIYLKVSSAELRRPARSEAGNASALAFRSTFAPGVAAKSDARPILLDPGQEHVVDLVLHREPAFSVAGLVSDERGPVSGALVSWADPGTTGFDDLLTTITSAAGRFEIHGLVAGDYTLTAKTPWNVSTHKTKSASYRLSVVDRPLSIAVSLRPEPVVSGRYVFDGSSRPPATVPSDFGLESEPAVRGWRWERWRLLDQPKQRPNTFAIDVEPGRRVLRLEGAPDGWMVRSITLGRRDITHAALDVTADVSDVVVTLTDRVTEVHGHITGHGGLVTRSGPDGLWIFPADPRRWVDFGPQPPDLRRLWIEKSGDFSEEGLSPGDYLIATLPSGLNGAPPDAGVFRAAAAGATKLSLAEGQRMAISLTANPFRRSPIGSIPWVVDELPPTRAEVRAVPGPSPAARGESASTIHGRVIVDGGQRPAPNTVVHLIPWPTSSEFTEYVDVQAAGLAGSLAVVDADGRFTFERVAPGPYVLRARNSAFGLASYPSRPAGSEPSVVVRADTAIPEIQLPMKPRAGLSVIVRDERGQAVAGANVWLNPPPPPISGSWVPRMEAKTNDRGECFFLGLEPGSYRVDVSAYREPRRATIASDFENPLAVLPRFRGDASVGVDLGVIAFEPGERRVLNVELRLAAGAERLLVGG